MSAAGHDACEVRSRAYRHRGGAAGGRAHVYAHALDPAAPLAELPSLSGDLGYFDERGDVHFVGRMKEMIRTGGINVAPAEIEFFLTTHPAVKEAIVVGMPDLEKDEVVAALVQLQPGATLSEQELRDFCCAQIAAYKVPRRIRFVSEAEVPRTVTGKVNKREIVGLLAEG